MRAGELCSSRGSVSRHALGYLGVVVAASFGDIRRMWPQPLTTAKASGTVSQPTNSQQPAMGGSQARLSQEGSNPSPAPEQKAQEPEAPLFSNDRVVPRDAGRPAQQVACSSISRFRRARRWNAMPARI